MSGYLKTALVAVVALAIVYRVSAIRQVVIGV